jgi:hypothetical protein
MVALAVEVEEVDIHWTTPRLPPLCRCFQQLRGTSSSKQGAAVAVVMMKEMGVVGART